MTGEEWVADYCARHDIDWDKLGKGDRTMLTTLVPCNIKCFRVGVAIDVKPGEKCPECGALVPFQTAWERISNEGVLDSV